MARSGKGLKKEWSSLPAECFETMTLRELKVGDKFLDLPSPGMNIGLGGFMSEYYIFQKIRRKEDGSPNASRLCDGALADFPDSMSVLKVE